MGISLEKRENAKARNIWSFLSIRLFFFVLAIFFLLSLTDCTRNTPSENINGLDKTFTEDTISTSTGQASGNITEKEKLNIKKIHPELSEFLNDKRPEDLVKVNIWIHADYESAVHAVADKYPEANLIGDRPSDNTDPELYEKIREEMYEVRAQVIRVAAEPIEAFIVSKGGTITYTSYMSPIIFA